MDAAFNAAIAIDALLTIFILRSKVRFLWKTALQQRHRSTLAFYLQGMVMINRRGLTIVELLVVLAFISITLALLLPAVQSARGREREAVCKNNVHQINLAIAQFSKAHKYLPRLGPPKSRVMSIADGSPIPCDIGDFERSSLEESHDYVH